MANAYKYAGPKKTQNCIGPDPSGPGASLVSGKRPVQRDCRNEPPYPGLDTVVFLMWAPDYPLTVHAKTALCEMDYPHEIKECGEWAVQP